MGFDGAAIRDFRCPDLYPLPAQHCRLGRIRGMSIRASDFVCGGFHCDRVNFF